MLRRLKEELRDSDGGSESGSAGSSSSVSSSSSSAASSDSSDSDRAPPSRATCSFSELKTQLETLLEEPERPFCPGDVVVWKEGCQNRKRPKAGEFAVVAHVLDHPVFGSEFVFFFLTRSHSELGVFFTLFLHALLHTTEILREARTSESRLTLS